MGRRLISSKPSPSASGSSPWTSSKATAKARRPHGELLDVGFHPILNDLGLVAGAKLDGDSGHILGDGLELASGVLMVGTLGALIDRIDRLEVDNLDNDMSLGGVGDGTHNTRVDGVLVFGTGSVGGQFDDIINREGTVSPDGGAVDGELGGGEGTSFIGAENNDGSQFLHGSDTGDDGLVFGELFCADCKGDGQDSGRGNGNIPPIKRTRMLLRPR